jgi:hypothetical protein
MPRPCRAGQSAEQFSLGGCKLRGVITAREKVPVAIERQHNRRVAEPLLHDFRRKLKAVDLAIDAPAGEEMTKRMQAGVPGPHCRVAVITEHALAVIVFHDVRDAGGDLGRPQATGDDVAVVFDPARPVRKYESRTCLSGIRASTPSRH